MCVVNTGGEAHDRIMWERIRTQSDTGASQLVIVNSSPRVDCDNHNYNSKNLVVYAIISSHWRLCGLHLSKVIVAPTLTSRS